MPFRTYFLAFCCVSMASWMFSGNGVLLADEPGNCWKNLFNGESLDGWVQKNGTASYQVEEGTIVGKTTEGSPNSFLCTEKEYGDFELEFEVKVHANLNSGVQVRSITAEANAEEEASGNVGRVNGPQVEIEAKDGVSGYIYDEATDRGWITPDANRVPHKHFHDGQWNHFRIVAKGPRIQTWINGEPIDDLTDALSHKTHPKGFIGLQVHAVSEGTGPYDVAWRKIRIKELSCGSLDE